MSVLELVALPPENLKAKLFPLFVSCFSSTKHNFGQVLSSSELHK